MGFFSQENTDKPEFRFRQGFPLIARSDIPRIPSKTFLVPMVLIRLRLALIGFVGISLGLRFLVDPKVIGTIPNG